MMKVSWIGKVSNKGFLAWALKVPYGDRSNRGELNLIKFRIEKIVGKN